MARRIIYQAVISNEFLGKSVVVRGESPDEVRHKMAAIQAKWAHEEARARERQRIADLRARAEQLSEEAAITIEQYRSLLKATLLVDDRLDWDSLYDRSSFAKSPPREDNIRRELGVPSESRVLEALWPGRRQRRLELEQRASEFYRERLLQWTQEKQAFQERQAAHNASIDVFRKSFETGEVEAIERYTRMILDRSEYPEEMPRDFAVQYRPDEKLIIVDYRLPNPHEVPRIERYRFNASKRRIEEVEMSQREFKSFYEEILCQIALRTIHEIFESDYPGHASEVVFNGWVETVDPATGRDTLRYVLSVRAEREQFSQFDLSRVEPRATIRALKGLIAGPLVELSPVRPIIELTREDPRFVEARELLDKLEAGVNLLDMPWDDFEHLVRELFERIFGQEGAEVRITRASRDYGVDAVVFHPHPLRGGKILIQAKRYSGLVPTAAVRELYGTMTSERASRGILVTSGYFGKDSYEFVHDKPITLIDGSNLVYLFQEHGYQVCIRSVKQERA